MPRVKKPALSIIPEVVASVPKRTRKLKEAVAPVAVAPVLSLGPCAGTCYCTSVPLLPVDAAGGRIYGSTAGPQGNGL